jgi:hypothetical protein
MGSEILSDSSTSLLVIRHFADNLTWFSSGSGMLATTLAVLNITLSVRNFNELTVKRTG